MVNIDDVYQKVLAIANKEQRGYITPQEFNLYANQAQQEIFEQYFYDLNQQARVPGNEYVYADVDDMLEEKLQIFENTDDAVTILGYTAVPGGFFTIPNYIYRISKIEYDHIHPATGNLIATRDVEILKTTDFQNCINGGPLTRPNDYRLVANIRNNVIRVIGGTTFNSAIPRTPTAIIYFKKPGGVNSAGTYPDVAWGYFVVGGKALYDTSVNKTFHFELHGAEENELVYKILKYAGVAMKRDDIMRAGQGLEMAQAQQEKQ